MKKASGNILIVDDNEITIEVIRRNLEAKGYQTLSAVNVPEALEILSGHPVSLVITDYKMPGYTGLDLIKHIRDHDDEPGIIMLTGYGSIDSAVAAIKAGADEYITKPFTDEELVDTVEKTIENLKERKIDPDAIYTDTWNQYGIIGESREMSHVYFRIQKAVNNDATILITGESGTGKELVARAIHYHHYRRSVNPFIPVNCPGIPVTLFESELFGHVKGAFTGADQHRKGFFQAAEKGSLFLDEISELPLELQAKLLRVIQEREIFRIGETQLKKIDVRIIAATNKPLELMVQKGLFRQDLFYRLNVISITVPPLRDRENDILLLAKHFAVKFAKELGQPEPVFSDDAVSALLNYTWPGNVRELENLIHGTIIMNESDVIRVKDFPMQMKTAPPALNRELRLSLEEMSKQYVRDVLRQTGGNKSKALDILKIDRKTMLKKLK